MEVVVTVEHDPNSRHGEQTRQPPARAQKFRLTSKFIFRRKRKNEVFSFLLMYLYFVFMGPSDEETALKRISPLTPIREKQAKPPVFLSLPDEGKETILFSAVSTSEVISA